ncbi:ABC transporter substrate-binding protein [Limobrevibacterium gyesilva]|uniref:ABC transporter substrate-binding protein n=1 Tax=Limobrevibacterium gyesilva TaxID=2991712 RepID=A0AA42CJF1_9PROT|nr:ABC transporter substrate-binding protein [Limobrevibacterium gyesilva]MCW3476810.1 ABC transporter substrate-binding protein [Limobrevibacterium gyesilva]
MTDKTRPDAARLSRRAALATGAATLALPLVARAQAPVVKVGLIHPVTGALAGAGQRCRMGGQMAITDINAAGGIKAMGGAKLEALLGDAQGRPEIAASLVDQMAEAGASGFTGCFASALGLAATQAAAKYNIPFSIDSGIADALTTRGLKNVFRFFPNNTTATTDAMAALDQINRKAGSPAKTAVIVHEDSEFGTNSAKLQAAALPKIGIEVKALIPHATPTRDFTNIVLRIKSEKPDLVVITNYENEYVLLARTLVQQRVDLVSTFSISGGGFSLKFAKEAPAVAENMIDFNHWYNPKDPRALAFRKRIEDSGQIFSWEYPFGYFAVRLLADAWERAGSADKDKTIAALAASTFSDHFMPYGPTKFTDGQNAGSHPVALQIQKGDIKVIWPEAFADAPAVFPRPKA